MEALTTTEQLSRKNSISTDDLQSSRKVAKVLKSTAEAVSSDDTSSDASSGGLDEDRTQRIAQAFRTIIEVRWHFVAVFDVLFKVANSFL